MNPSYSSIIKIANTALVAKAITTYSSNQKGIFALSSDGKSFHYVDFTEYLWHRTPTLRLLINREPPVHKKLPLEIKRDWNLEPENFHGFLDLEITILYSELAEFIPNLASILRGIEKEKPIAQLIALPMTATTGTNIVSNKIISTLG